MDQDRINRFARLSNRYQTLEEDLKTLLKDRETMEDAQAQIEEFGVMAEEVRRRGRGAWCLLSGGLSLAAGRCD